MNAARPVRLAVALVLAAVALAPAAAAAKPRASFTAVEYELMCTSCHEPLALAQSPQAQAEKDAVRAMIAQGLTTKQIENQMVAAFGIAVLAKPPAHGFDLTVYILPPAVLLAGVAILLVTLPKWRARARQASEIPLATAQPLAATDAQRLNEELERFV